MENLLKGYKRLYNVIDKVREKQTATTDEIVLFIATALGKHLSNHGIYNLAADYRLNFCEAVDRPLLKYRIVGLTGTGEPIVESHRKKLVDKLTWKHLDADTVRECFYEFEEAFGIALSNENDCKYL